MFELYDRLSSGSRRFRFFATIASTEDEVFRLLQMDPNRDCALVAEAAGHISGIAAYVHDTQVPGRAEVVFAIADSLQGRGVGTRMLEVLADIARNHRITTFDAYVQQDNRQMMRVFLDSGFETQRELDGGVFHVALTLAQSDRYGTLAAERSRTAAAASMKSFFEPRTVVVVGANRERGKIGSEILHNVASGGFTGRLFAVHPTAASIDGVPAYPSVTDIPGDVELAIICVPGARVSAVVDDCIAKHVKALVIISAGFAETGAAGRTLERDILGKVRTAGIRMIGPNCMGIINTHPSIRLNATFSPVAPTEGRVAFSTQSGALGLAILDYVRQLDFGISTFVSVGNKADVSGNDLIQYWADDPCTDVILLYLESFGNPRRFAQIARRVAAQKPIVAVKAGRSPAGARAASSHTGALAASDVVVEALFREAGIIRTTTLEELFDVAALLAHQPVPAGSRVAILSNVGGPAILAADACESHGLVLAMLTDATREVLKGLLPAEASIGNPIDMIASATATQYERATRALLADEQVDSLLVIFTPPLVTQADDVARAIVAGAKGVSKTVVANFISSRGAPRDISPIPSYRFPEAAVAALARATAYGAWRRRPQGVIPVLPGFQADVIRSVVDGALQRGDGWLTSDEAQRLAGAAGIASATARVVTSIDAAIAAAQQTGYPAVLKALGPTILHKSDVGGVVLGLDDDASLRSAFEELASRFGHAMTGALVQRMVPGGVEILLGGVVDPTFGPLVACGSGGVLVDLLADTVFRLHPLTDLTAADMVGSLKGAPLLRGYRGHPPADERSVVDALLRVSALMTVASEIQELDINPLKVFEHGVMAVDVRVRVARPRNEPLPTSRRISY
ncbi:MAG: GNAT family N-acetyltransferase [Acidobacteria bacterium]|nr:GNAT family N-acetyltransferase [Acidobacteriota bacterium]